MIYLLLVPALLLPIAAVGLHSAACGMHVAAVDMMRNQKNRAVYQGAFYRYCRFVSAPFRS